jgi:tetratricopeptide (TPR) repeat protein
VRAAESGRDSPQPTAQVRRWDPLRYTAAVMHWLRRTALVLLVASGVGSAVDPLSQANDAFRNGDYARAVELFQVAAELEPRPEVRATIWVKLAWTYFALQRQDKAETALLAALKDQPTLELAADYYSDEFLALYSRVKARAAALGGSAEPRAVTPEVLASLRRQAEEAADPPTLERLLRELATLEATAPPSLAPQLFDLRAAVLERLGRSEEALESLGRAAAARAGSAISPGAGAIPFETINEGKRLVANGQPNDAAALMRGILAIQPSCGPALEVLGEAYLAAGRLDAAHAALRAAILADPRPDLFLLLGEADLRRRNLAGAREAFRRAAELDPTNERALAALGLLAASTADLPAAQTALDAALARNATLFEARVVRGQIALASGDTAVATQHFQQALQVRPDDPWARAWLGLALLARGDVATALPFLPAEAAGLPALFVVARAEALRRLGRSDEALALLATPASADAAAVAALCQLQRNQPEAAATILDAAGELAPANARLRYLRALTRAAQGDRQAALSELEQASKLAGCPPLASESARNLETALAAEELMRTALRPPAAPPRR